MGMAAILVMWPRPYEQTFVTPSHWGSIWNLALIGQAVLEKKIFENGGRLTDRPWLDFNLTSEPKGSGELKMGWSENSKPKFLRLAWTYLFRNLYIVLYTSWKAPWTHLLAGSSILYCSPPGVTCLYRASEGPMNSPVGRKLYIVLYSFWSNLSLLCLGGPHELTCWQEALYCIVLLLE